MQNHHASVRRSGITVAAGDLEKIVVHLLPAESCSIDVQPIVEAEHFAALWALFPLFSTEEIIAVIHSGGEIVLIVDEMRPNDILRLDAKKRNSCDREFVIAVETITT